MSFIRSREKEINCKIIYYGPAFSGKTASLHALYKKTNPNQRGKLTTLSESGENNLFFDFLPLSLGEINGYKVRLHVYTVPGQIVYDSSRTLIFKGVDGVVFVADSQIGKLEDNFESWNNLQKNLKNHHIPFQTVPMAIQYNKQDLKHVVPAEDLRDLFANRSLLEFETVATEGKQVLECFQAVAKQVLKELK